MISGIPLVLGLGTRISNPCVYVVFWAPNPAERMKADAKFQLPTLQTSVCKRLHAVLRTAGRNEPLDDHLNGSGANSRRMPQK